MWGISMVRDEADVIGPVVEHMAGQVDHLLVADNGSVDATPDILRAYGVEVVEDPERGYYQSAKMTRLAHAAMERGATWVVPFDADEVWYSPFGRIGDLLDGLAEQWLTATAELYDQVPTALDPDEPNPIKRIGWRRRKPAPLPKVACRLRPDLTIAQGNHGAHYEGGATAYPGQLVVRHYPYRSVDQFERKVRNGAQAYAASDLPQEMGAHWRGYGRILAHDGPEALAAVFRQWFWAPDPSVDESLVYDPAPV